MTIKQYDICYIISHGFAARMLIQTNLLLKLADKGISIAIITPDDEDPILDSLKDHSKIYIFKSAIKQSLRDDNYDFMRRYFLEDLEANPVFMEKHWHSLLYSKSKHPWKRIRPLLYYSAYKLISVFPSIRDNFKKKENQYLTSPDAIDLIKQINPRLIVSTYPINYLESKITYAAQTLNIPSVYHLLSWDNITSKGIFPVIPDYFLAWGEIMVSEILEYYRFKKDKIYKVGVPHFDHHIQVKNNPNIHQVLERIHLTPSAPFIFLAMSSPRFAPYEIEIVEWLANKTENNIFGNKMQLVIRPHPQNVQGVMADPSWLGRLKKLTSDRVAIDFPKLNQSKIRWSMQSNDMDNLSNFLAGCAVCLNSGSTVSIDALIMDKPVIITSFDADRKLSYWKSARRLVSYIHLRKLIEYNGVSVVYNFEELTNEILTYIQNPDYKMGERKATLEAECHVPDGNSTMRAVEAMESILELEKI